MRFTYILLMYGGRFVPTFMTTKLITLAVSGNSRAIGESGGGLQARKRYTDRVLVARLPVSFMGRLADGKHNRNDARSVLRAGQTRGGESQAAAHARHQVGGTRGGMVPVGTEDVGRSGSLRRMAAVRGRKSVHGQEQPAAAPCRCAMVGTRRARDAQSHLSRRSGVEHGEGAVLRTSSRLTST